MTDITMDTIKTFLGTYPSAVIAQERDLLQEGGEMTTPPFTDKATYLAWVKEWKALLKQVEATIRLHKQARRGDQSGFHQSQAQVWKQCAHALLIRRALAKHTSARMRAERLVEVAA